MSTLNELDAKTLNSYIQKAALSAVAKGVVGGQEDAIKHFKQGMGSKLPTSKANSENIVKALKRSKFIGKASNKLAAKTGQDDDIESQIKNHVTKNFLTPKVHLLAKKNSIQEISKDMIFRYHSEASLDAKTHKKLRDESNVEGHKHMAKIHDKFYKRRVKGLALANKKLVDGKLDEDASEFLNKYIMNALKTPVIPKGQELVKKHIKKIFQDQAKAYVEGHLKSAILRAHMENSRKDSEKEEKSVRNSLDKIGLVKKTVNAEGINLINTWKKKKKLKMMQEDDGAPTNSMGNSSSTQGPIQTFDPLLFAQKKLLSRKRPKGVGKN